MSHTFEPTIRFTNKVWKQEIYDSISLLDSIREEMKSETQLIIYSELARLHYPHSPYDIASELNEKIHYALSEYLENDVKESLLKEFEETDVLNKDNILVAIFVQQKIDNLTNQRSIHSWKKYIKDFAKHQGEAKYQEIISPPVYTVNFTKNQTWR